MTLPTPRPTVVFQKLDDGAVLFAPESETYFGLNEVGAHVWQALPPRCATLDALVNELTGRYPEVPPATIRADAAELVDALLQAGLVLPGASAAGDARPAS